MDLAATEGLVRNCRFVVPSLPRAENPQTQARSYLDTQSWEIQATYTHGEQHTHSFSGKCQQGECQGKRDYICTLVG